MSIQQDQSDPIDNKACIILLPGATASSRGQAAPNKSPLVHCLPDPFCAFSGQCLWYFDASATSVHSPGGVLHMLSLKKSRPQESEESVCLSEYLKFWCFRAVMNFLSKQCSKKYRTYLSGWGQEQSLLLFPFDPEISSVSTHEPSWIPTLKTNSNPRVQDHFTIISTHQSTRKRRVEALTHSERKRAAGEIDSNRLEDAKFQPKYGVIMGYCELKQRQCSCFWARTHGL